MATPDVQSPEVGDPPSLPVETQQLDNKRGGAWSRHDWVTYALVAGLAVHRNGRDIRAVGRTIATTTRWSWQEQFSSPWRHQSGFVFSVFSPFRS